MRRSGSELYAAELAEALIARGHSAVLYTPSPGELARQLHARSIPVVSDLRRITEPPDIIHGQHTHETLTALMAFPAVPAIQMHHGWVDAAPVPLPRIMRHVPVDDTVRDRLVSEWGIPPERIELIRNFVNPALLPPRGVLPPRPAKAVVFSNSAAHYVDAIRSACAARGIHVDAVGADVGNAAERPGEVLGGYDVVFAKARCAMEAMAVGTAVVLCDRSGLGPMVDSRNFDELRRLNFGLRTLRAPITGEAIGAVLDRYDPVQASLVSGRIRAEAGIDAAVDQLLALYEQVIAQWQEQPRPPLEHEMRCLADYLQQRPAEPSARLATAALFKAAYEGLRAVPGVRWLLPSPSTALRIHRRLRQR
ncbi:MAG: glycosyltransferase [Vicinamibacterales bacterium]